jgi:excinuclease UvrABC ATPase subunit
VADIVVTRARTHNLRDVSVRVPHGRLTVVTGVSGSGKSSLVFGTIAAEAQRALADTYPAFVRHRLPRQERPDADAIEHLTPAVVVDQRPVGGGARSTVGTMTDVHPTLRVLFSRYGTPSAGESNRYSFNDPAGMCPACEGLGTVAAVDVPRVLDETRSLNDGAIRFPPYRVGSTPWQIYARSGLFDPDRPVAAFPAADRDLLLHGEGFTVQRSTPAGGVYRNRYEGLVPSITRRYLRAGADKQRLADGFVARGRCPDCGGARVNAAARASRLDGRSIADLTALEIGELTPLLAGMDNPVAAAAVATLRRIEQVGLGYLSLDRATPTLSGGEAQRLKTVRYLGSALTGMTYVFDEPSAGLHPRDVERLIGLLHALRDNGNTVLVVEHDRAVTEAADHVVDIGPGAGAAGGRIVYAGPVDGLRTADTATGRALARPARVTARHRTPTGHLPLRGGRHNLALGTIDVPTGVLTVVTGVAGAGKSTLVRELAAQYPDAVVVDQGPVAASVRSTPASHLSVLEPLRRMFAAAHGVPPGLFSFNSTGACPRCDGRGEIRTDLAFLDPVTVACEACGGSRYSPEALAYRVGGMTIVDVLALTAEQAVDRLTDPAVRRRLAPAVAVGLGYLTLGQPLSTLSGGERQRLKLAGELSAHGTVYLLDEPTTGLSPTDVDVLLRVLDGLVDNGNTVVVAEHELAVVRHADHVIDLGPGAGRHGGRVVFAGPVGALAAASGSYTAEYLRRDLTATPPG